MTHRRATPRQFALYALAIAREFRWTLMLLPVVVLLGACIFRVVPEAELGGGRPSLGTAVYAAWMALLAQPVFTTPGAWYLLLINALYPVAGVLLIGEGVVRFALLMISRRHGERQWMDVMASTYRDHVVLCGLGHLGIRILEQLTRAGVDVVVLERDAQSRFMPAARELGVPVLIRDMKEDQALIDAGIPAARTVVIATNDDMANIEVALDSRRLNPKIRVVMRLFDQAIASKIKGALMVDEAFSSSTLAAPMVAALAFDAKVLSTTMIAGIPHVTTQLAVAAGSALAGRGIGEVEDGYAARVLARTAAGAPVQLPPSAATRVAAGDELVVHCPASQLTTLAAAVAGPARA